MPNFNDVPERAEGTARPSAAEITGILFRWSQGDEHALDSLTPLVYRDLRRIAARLLRNERSGHSLQPTALVNEAYLKLAGKARVRILRQVVRAIPIWDLIRELGEWRPGFGWRHAPGRDWVSGNFQRQTWRHAPRNCI